MSKKIVIDLTLSGTETAVDELFEFDQRLRANLAEICRQLAEIGAAVARTHCADWRGNTDAFIDTHPMSNGYKISMSGSDVYFIEFGTGIDVKPHGDAVSIPIYSGSYSETHAKQFSTYGFWYYAGERLEGTRAYMPMFYAGQAIRENANRVAKEVLGL